MQHLKTFLRTARANAKGESVLYFRIGTDWISTDIKLLPQYWDAANELIKKTHPRYYQLNPLLQMLKLRAEQCISNFQFSGNAFNRKFFIEYVFDSPENAINPCFLKLIDEYCNVKALSWERSKHYRELKKDIVAVMPVARLQGIDFKFINRLQSYLKTKAIPNNENTIIRKIKQVKAVVHYCQDTGLLNVDPLAKIKLKQIKGEKKFLTAEELELLENLYQQGFYKNEQLNVLRYFLFSCYTALRYSDIKKLKVSEIINGEISTYQEKTNKPVQVPIIPKAAQLIQPLQNGKCFKVLTNQATNRILKDIIAAAGIHKKITYHCSRHTFGTLSIYWGIPREVVAELMGVDDKTVKIYAQILNDVKIREMQKWNSRAV